MGFNAVGTATLFTLGFAASVLLSGCAPIGAGLGTPSSSDLKSAGSVASSELSGIRRDARVIVRLRSGETKKGNWIGLSRWVSVSGDSLHAVAGSKVWAGGGIPTTVEIPGDSLRGWFAEKRWPSDIYALLQHPRQRNRDAVIDSIPLAEVKSVDLLPWTLDSGTAFKVASFALLAAGVVAVHILSGLGAALR